MSAASWYVVLGVIMVTAGAVRLLLVRDLYARLVAMNVTGSGSLLVLLALASRSDPIDPVLSALVLTGLVITVAFTGLGAVLVRRIEAHVEIEADEEAHTAEEAEEEHVEAEADEEAKAQDAETQDPETWGAETRQSEDQNTEIQNTQTQDGGRQ